MSDNAWQPREQLHPLFADAVGLRLGKAYEVEVVGRDPATYAVRARLGDDVRDFSYEGPPEVPETLAGALVEAAYSSWPPP